MSQTAPEPFVELVGSGAPICQVSIKKPSTSSVTRNQCIDRNRKKVCTHNLSSNGLLHKDAMADLDGAGLEPPTLGLFDNPVHRLSQTWPEITIDSLQCG